MKAHGYLQIVPDRRSDGKARSLSIQRVTQRHPRDPLPGAIVVGVSIDIPEEVASAQTVEAVAAAGALSVVIEPEEAGEPVG